MVIQWDCHRASGSISNGVNSSSRSNRHGVAVVVGRPARATPAPAPSTV